MGGSFRKFAGGTVVPQLLVLLLGALATGCQNFDPNRLDGRLRGATFDAYVDTIDRLFGGLGAAGITAEELSTRYRERAIVAETVAGFYGVLRAMLAELDDPHAALEVSPRFWKGPVAEPEWVQFTRHRGAVWIGVPESSLRTPGEMSARIAEWLEPLGVRHASELDPSGIAHFLRSSAAYGPTHLTTRQMARLGRFGGMEDSDPRMQALQWLELRTIDGQPLETTHDAELLIRGALGSVAHLGVGRREEGGRSQEATIALLRNAGVFESERGEGGVRHRLSAMELADRLDPSMSEQHHAYGGRSPAAASRALRKALGRSAFRLGHRLELPGEESEAFGLEAWRLRTPAGATAAYLRVGRFRGAVDEAAETKPLGIARPLQTVMAAFDGIDHWIIDVTQNPGGSWQEAGWFLSYFLGPEDEIVPHVVTTVRTTGNFLFRTRTKEIHRLERVDVKPVAARTIHVLVDQNTASAGEIVASTLRGKSNAVVVGEQTAGAEYSTAEFEAPDGSILRIGLSGGMIEPYESFQGRGLTPDIAIQPPYQEGANRDLEVWRTIFRYEALRAALTDIDQRESGGMEIDEKEAERR